jgi:hypothetical protein
MSQLPQVVRFSSALRAAPDAVWEHARSLDGINEELWPLHLSGPADAVISDQVPLGQPLFRSVLSLLRVIVLDLHEFKLLRVNVGEGFHESSRSLLERRWEHVRSIRPEPGGCVVTDELEFEPRITPVLIAGLVRRVFQLRHERLRSKFGELITRT